MPGQATSTAWRSAVACLCAGFAAAAVLLFPLPAFADPTETYGWREFWTGVDASNHVWLAYSGATIAPSSDMFSDGVRLRAATGFGEYSYVGERDAREQSFSAQTGFADALVGYLERLGPLTADRRRLRSSLFQTVSARRGRARLSGSDCRRAALRHGHSHARQLDRRASST